MRKIETHKVNGCNDKLEIIAMDAPGSGGANHHYQVSILKDEMGGDVLCNIHFQNGPIKECGTNGLTQEVLMAIVADRLQAFQNGPFACVENQEALDCVNEAIGILQDRTLKRMKRGVEGTHQK